MTEKQINFVTRLAGEKDLATLSDAQRAYVGRIVSGEVDPPVAAASRIIDALLALPSKPGAAAPAAAPAADVPAGRYALVGEDGVVKFYVVDRPTEGKWAGYLFLSAQASDEKYPIRNRETKTRILAEIAVDPEGALRRYGHELGRCGVCGRTLTDETSRAAGIGPDCADRLGIDRTPYTARAEREAVERAIGRDEARIAEDGGRSTLDDEAGDDESPAAPYAPETTIEAAATEEPRETPAAPENRSHGRTDPSRAMTWRQRNAAVREQQADAGPTKREYPALRRAAAGVAAGFEAPFTVVSGGATEVFENGDDAYLAARAKWQAAPFSGRVLVHDSRGETVADFDF